MRDVIVVGGGHNGLVAAAYLAAAGLKVTVLERRAIVGGAAVTEEFHPGFRNSVAAYTVSLLNPKIIRDLDLHRHGLRIVERPLSNFLPLPDGRYLKAAPGRTRAEVAKFSARDAERLDAYEARLERMADVLRALALETPPNVATGQGLIANLSALLDTARVANRLRPLGFEGQRDLVEIFTRSAGDLPRPMVRKRSDQGDPRLRRNRRNLRQSLCRRHRLRAAAPLLRRDQRQEGRLGPRDRRHGRDHPSDGALMRGPRGRHPHERGGRRNPGGERPRRRRRHRQGRKDSRRAPSSPTFIRSSHSKSCSIPRRCQPTFAPASVRGAAPPACSA